MIFEFLKFIRQRRYKVSSHQKFNPNLPVMLTYLCPDAVKPSGGTKVIYQHVSHLNQMKSTLMRAQVFHAKTPAFRCSWDFLDLDFKKNFVFNPMQELYIVHEMWAAREAPLIAKVGISYAIFVQNGYFMQRKASFEEAKFAYENATHILCVSEDIEKCIEFLFPALKKKIIRLSVSVDASLFKPAEVKENLITYMPRKLKKHADLVLFFLQGHLPPNWRVEAIDALSQSQVAEKLSKSKIFLSFSELEGLGLPPIEAALAGNKVIGYTGQGGREYWESPVFEEIDCGNILGYVSSILNNIKAWDENRIDQSSFSRIRKELDFKYNAKSEKLQLEKFINEVVDYFRAG
jgi:glycosyltransferase involved in cell wall biosynthesis